MSLAISVLVPVYNVENYIERCLLSILNNTIIDKCEIILVNDASTDSSVIRIQSIMDKYPEQRIYLYSNPENKGLGYTRQEALNHAKGKYIICVDSDDWVEPDYLEQFYTKAEEINADLVCCQWFDESNETIIRKSPLPEDPNEAIKAILTFKAFDTVWTKFYRKNVFDENKITWDPRFQFMEDTLINLKYLSFTKTIVNVDKPLYHYNMTNLNSISKERNVEYYIKTFPVFDEIELFYKNRGIINKYYNEFLFMKIRNKYNAICLSSFKEYFNVCSFSSEEINYVNTSGYYSSYQKLLISSIYKHNKIILFVLFLLKKMKIFVKKLV